MYFEKFNTGTAVAMETVDGIPAPAEILAQAKQRATETGKVHFVGVIEERNPNFVEPKFDSLLEAWAGAPPSNRYILTGEFIISDDRGAVLTACGRLIWVTPAK